VFDYAGVLWMVAPFVVGCVAVAEERRYNTLESSLRLPAPKRRQFAAKFAVVMVLGTMLGAVFPWGLESLGGGKSVGWTKHEALPLLAGAAIAVTGISFFASTLSRGMLQAFTVALLFPILLAASVLLSLETIGVGTNFLAWVGALFPVDNLLLAGVAELPEFASGLAPMDAKFRPAGRRFGLSHGAGRRDLRPRLGTGRDAGTAARAAPVSRPGSGDDFRLVVGRSGLRLASRRAALDRDKK
jgi:hypothetical protein